MIQGALEEAIHEQDPPEAVMLTDPEPPLEGCTGLFAEIEKEHGAPG
jgi:hypothetical protein